MMAMSKHLTPYEVSERLIGPPAVLAGVCELNEKSPFHWRRSSDLRDAGDLPSARIMRRLLAHAAAKGIPLTAEHLIWGADAAEIEALLATPRDVPPPCEAAE